MSEEKELICALSNHKIAEFIDLGKLIKSQTMLDITEFSARHSIEHGDRSYVEKILEVFKGTKYFPVLLQWFCSRAGLEVKYDKNSFWLQKSSSEPNQHVLFCDALGHAVSITKNKKQSKQNIAPETAVNQKNKRRLKKIDMLDSRARLPGSFEAGKRR